MGEAHDTAGSRDAFGDTVGERLWRRLAGAGLTIAVAAALAVLASPASLTFVLVGAAVLMVPGVPVSWLIERLTAGRRRRWSVLRHVGAGAVLALLVGFGLSLYGGGWLLVTLLFSVPIGTMVAGVAAGAGLTLPARLVRPVAVGGLLITAALPVGVWLEQRPPAPYDFLVVDGTTAVRERFGGPEGLATAIAEGFEHQAAAGRPRTAHSTWVAVSQRVRSDGLENSRAWTHVELDDARPLQRSSGEPIRLVTVIVRGEDDRACVVVTADETRVEPQACSRLAVV